MQDECNETPEHEKPGFNLESLVPADAFKDESDVAKTEAKAAKQAAKASATTPGAASVMSSGDDSASRESAATFEVDEGSSNSRTGGKQRGGGGVRVVIFRTLDDPGSSKCAAVIGGFIMLLIFLGSVTFVLESLPDVKERWSSEMAIFEAVCVVSFTVDYVMRVLTCTTRAGPNGLIEYLVQPLNLVDIASILPWYMEHLFQLGGSMAILRVLRMARIFRVMKIGSFAEELQVFSNGVKEAMPGLTLLCFMLMIYLVVFGAFFNMLEDEAHRNYPCGTADTSVDCVPEGKNGFESIPSAIWFVLATLTTVGYGDVYPLTTFGKLAGCVCMLTGILVLALPIVLVGNAFQEAFDERQKVKDATKALAAARGVDVAAVENPVSFSSPEQTEWSLADDLLQEQHNSKKQVAIGLLARLAAETKDPCYEQCIALLTSVDVLPAAAS